MDLGTVRLQDCQGRALADTDCRLGWDKRAVIDFDNAAATCNQAPQPTPF